jgi:hypothetical protein
MNKPLRIVAVVMTLSMAAFAAIAYDPPPDSVAQAGDPARWYKPADTPDKLYHTAMKEAGAALKEALSACRAETKSERRDCAADAMRTYRDDVAAAKNIRSGG